VVFFINDEEEKLFPKVREVLSEKELKALGAELKEAKSSSLDSDLLSQPLGFAREEAPMAAKAS
jgi:hemerythrin superfamily protein